MINKNLGEKCLQYMKEEGAQKSQYHLTRVEKTEINFNNTGVGLFRTTDHNEVSLKAIKDNKMAKTMLTNVEDNQFIKDRIKTLIEMCDSSEEDSNNDIADVKSQGDFCCGPKEADIDRMYAIIEKLLRDCKEQFPELKFNESFICFNKVEEHFMNSNGVNLSSSKGEYSLNIGYAAKDGEKSSSFSGVYVNVEELPEDLLQYGDIKQKIKENVEQLNCKSIKGKFDGSIIITPDCFLEFIDTYNNIFLGDSSLITKTSILKDKLNEKIADEKLTVSCSPLNDAISSKAFITKDGFKAENLTYIENGVLKSFLVSLYGAKKTGLKLNPTVDIIVVEPGDKSLEDIIKSTEKGVLLGRFSGGAPASNGDFSGVAKNSYYIENGKVQFPLIETMVSGNLYEMLNSIESISKETSNMGYAIVPWVKANGVVISGKEE